MRERADEDLRQPPPAAEVAVEGDQGGRGLVVGRIRAGGRLRLAARAARAASANSPVSRRSTARSRSISARRMRSPWRQARLGAVEGLEGLVEQAGLAEHPGEGEEGRPAVHVGVDRLGRRHSRQRSGQVAGEVAGVAAIEFGHVEQLLVAGLGGEAGGSGVGRLCVRRAGPARS